jgi:hypothetical protein
MNEIANTNKHFALRAFILTRPDAFFTARIVGPGGLEEIVSPGGAGLGWDPRSNEITLASALAGSKVDMNVNITASVAIEGIQIQGYQSASSFLDAAQKEVERVLVVTEAECHRLGFDLHLEHGDH